MQKFILLRGHEGAGKTTYAAQLIAQFQHDYPQAQIVYIDNDQAITDPQGNYRFDFEQFAAAHRQNQARQQAAFEYGKAHPQADLLIINANPNQKRKTCEAMLAAARSHGFSTETYRLHHFHPNLHGVSPEEVAQSYARLNANPVEGEIHIGKVDEKSTNCYD